MPQSVVPCRALRAGAAGAGIVYIPALRIGAHGLRALITCDAAAAFCNDLAGSEHARVVFFWQMFTHKK